LVEILQNTAATLSVTFSAGDADSNNVRITVTDQDGNTVVNNQSATHGAANSGYYSYSLAPQTAPAWLTVTWSGTWGDVAQSLTTGAGQTDAQPAEVQVTGGHMFTVAQLRAFGDGALASSTTYPDATLIDTRSRVTMLFEDFCNVAFVNRYGRVSLDGVLSRTVWLPNMKVNKIRTVTINGIALDAGQLAQITVYPYGKLDRLALWPPYVTKQNIVIGYEHGYTYTPQDVARAAMMLARYETITTELSDRMISFSNDLGIIRQALPDRDHPTGIPSVDSVLCRYREHSPFERSY
jgi:hypothetical protein